jgi:hypothetical protein
MQSGFTSDPPRPRPEDFPDQVVYTLDRLDYVAYRMFLYDRDPPSRRRNSGGLGAALGCWFLAFVFAGLACLLCWGLGKAPYDPSPPGALLIMLPAAMFLLWLALMSAARAGALHPFEDWGRDGYARRLAAEAQRLEVEGEINRARIHWLILHADGFIKISELRSQQGGTTHADYRETYTSWHLLEEIVVVGHNLFLVTRDGPTHVLPTTAFAGPEAVEQFVNKVRTYQRAAQAREPKDSTGLERSEGVRPAP